MKHRLIRIMMFLFTVSICMNADSREPLWRFITGGRIRAYPALGRDGSVYLISDDRFLYSLSHNGEQRWRFYLEERITDCFAVGADGTIYVGYKTGELIAVHGYGKKIWQFATRSTINQSPALRSDGTILLATDEGTLFAVSHTGSLHWRCSLPGKPSSPPVVDADGCVYVTLEDGLIVALYPWGEKKWNLSLTGVPSSPAIGRDGTIYVGTTAGVLYAISGLPKIKWRTDIKGALFSPVIGWNDVVYVCSTRGELAAFSKEGQVLWSLPLMEIPSGPCVLGETGTIFVSTTSSTLFAVDPLGHIRWNARVKGVLTNLVLSPGMKLYAGSSDWAMYAFAGENPAKSAWPMYQHDVSHSGRSTRAWAESTIDDLYKSDVEFNYFKSLLLSGTPELMEKALFEIRQLPPEKKMSRRRQYLLYLLGKIAGFTVIQDDSISRFPLRGFSQIREESCGLYSEIGGLEAYPLLLKILENDEDMTMKTVAVRCLARVKSDPDGYAVDAMARLITARSGITPDNSFALNVVIAIKNISEYHGFIPGNGISALFAIAKGPYTASVRVLARQTLLTLGSLK